MKVNKIADVLDKFLTNNQKTILINGDWGVGKTYQVNKFVKNHPNTKNLKIIYTSLFGKNSKEEIHTEIYSKLHPRINLLNKSVGLVSTAISLVPQSPDVSKTLDFVLDIVDVKVDELNKKVPKNKKQIVIIFDDLERKGADLNFGILLGYFNQLMLCNFKIAVICSEKELKDSEDYFNFKEKIFDRYYSITIADEDVIRNYFQEDGKLLDKDIISLFNNNLRMASKTSKFYFEAKKRLEKEKITFSKGTILWYSTLVVISLNRGDLLVEIEEKDDSRYVLFEYDERLRKIMLSTYKYDNKQKHIFKIYGNLAYIEALVDGYLYDDFSKLIKCLIPSDTPTSTVMDQEIFFLDKEGKKKIIKEKIDFIFSSSNITYDFKLLSHLNKMYEYKKYFPENFDEEKFINNLAFNYVGKEEDLSYANHHLKTKNFASFLEKLNERNKQYSRDRLLKELKEKLSSDSFYDLQDYLHSFRYKSVIFEEEKVHPEVKKFIIDNNYCLPSLEGTISKNIWHQAHEAGHLAIALGLGQDMEEYLKKMRSETKDDDVIERVDELIKYALRS